MTEPPAPPPGGGSQPPDWGEMGQKLRAAQGPNRVMLIAGLLFFVDSFLPWYGFKITLLGQRFAANIKGWSAGGLAVIAILLAIAATVLAAMEVLGAVKDMSVPSGTLSLALSGGAFVFTLLRWVTHTSIVKYGLYVALILGAVMTYAAYQKFHAQS
ncbi:MAG: hypothetical protein E6G68_07745 [Actinobacteria bacterium]|nr:MAG: hypothetical protein E6G68_07745 [Actinomycetota bacterium]